MSLGLEESYCEIVLSGNCGWKERTVYENDNINNIQKKIIWISSNREGMEKGKAEIYHIQTEWI